MRASRFAAGALAASTSILPIAYVLQGREARGDVRSVPGAHGAAANDWVTNLWTVAFDLEDIAELVVPGERLHRETRFTGMRYGVGAFPDLFVAARGVAGRYYEMLDFRDKSMLQEWRSTGAPKLPKSSDETRRELLVGRHVKLCYDSLSVQNEGSRNSAGAPNTFVVSNNFRWPSTWKETARTSPPATFTGDLDDAEPLLTATEAEVPYDHAQLVNRGTADLPLWNGAASPVAALPMYNGGRTPISAGSFRKIKRSITYTITRKPMELVFMSQCGFGQSPPSCVRDLVGTPYLICSTCRRVSDFYATDDKDYHVVHPNVSILLKIGGEDVTRFMMTTSAGARQYFDIARRRRVWDQTLGPDDAPVGRMTLETTGPNGWIDDFTGQVGSGRFTEPNWYDMPSPALLRPPTWPRQRLVQEFLVGVKRFPEFGFLYFFVTIDTKPGWYRVRKSQARKITAQEWCRIEATPRSLADLSQPQADDSGWRAATP